MSEHDPHWYLEDKKPSLRSWIFTQMAIGAGWGAIVFFGVIFFIFILIAISTLLPEDPFAALEPATGIQTATV